MCLIASSRALALSVLMSGITPTFSQFELVSFDQSLLLTTPHSTYLDKAISDHNSQLFSRHNKRKASSLTVANSETTFEVFSFSNFLFPTIIGKYKLHKTLKDSSESRSFLNCSSRIQVADFPLSRAFK